MNRQYTFLTGDRVSVEFTAVDLSRTATMGQPVTYQDWSFELLVGSPELGDVMAAENTGVDLDTAYSVSGGQLRTGAGRWIDEHENVFVARLGVWTKDAWSVLAHLYGPSTDADLLELFSGLQPTVLETGVVVELGESVRVLESGYLAQQIPDIGILELLPATDDVLLSIPSVAGAPVAGGELFRDTRTDPPTPVLVASSCIARIHPVPVYGDPPSVDPGSRAEAALNVASSLVCHWN